MHIYLFIHNNKETSHSDFFDKKIDNSQEYTTIINEIKKEKKLSKYEINKKIDNIFKSKNYIYKIKVKIKLNDKDINTSIIGKTNTHLITINNELININDIIDIKKVD